jgi:hypothetical protein
MTHEKVTELVCARHVDQAGGALAIEQYAGFLHSKERAK